MAEDDLYRTSTQYRLWAFTTESLESLRSSTNASAAERVKAAVKRARQQRLTSTSSADASSANASQGESLPDRTRNKDGEGNTRSQDGGQSEPGEVQCLTVEEEQKLVRYYCVKAMEMADFCKFPTNVKATAVQYLKRFYLSNSPMTYHPKSIMPCALFLATKTETHYTSLKSFASKVPKIAAEDIIAPEFLITQALRFTFDVRHPFRSLEGGFMELLAMADGKEGVVRDSDGKSVQERMKEVESPDGSKRLGLTTEDVKNRIREAHGKAKEILKTSALLSDAYFLYTPAQIWLASLLVVDKPLALFYLDSKLPHPTSSEDVDSNPEASIKAKLLPTLRALVRMLQSSPSQDEMAELRRIDKKLYQCRNPEKIDLVGLNQAVKREGGGGGGGGAEGDEPDEQDKAAKKRKGEREKMQREGDDLFGGPITK